MAASVRTRPPLAERQQHGCQHHRGRPRQQPDAERGPSSSWQQGQQPGEGPVGRLQVLGRGVVGLPPHQGQAPRPERRPGTSWWAGPGPSLDDPDQAGAEQRQRDQCSQSPGPWPLGMVPWAAPGAAVGVQPGASGASDISGRSATPTRTRATLVRRQDASTMKISRRNSGETLGRRRFRRTPRRASLKSGSRTTSRGRERPGGRGSGTSLGTRRGGGFRSVR